MFRYKRIKFDLTEKEIRELKEGRAAFLINKKDKTAMFMTTKEVNVCFKDIVKILTSKRPIEQIGIFEPLEIMEKSGWLFLHSHTCFGYIKIDEFTNKAKVYIDTRDYQGK